MLLYYSMLNLAKSLIKLRSPNVDLSHAYHGLVATHAGTRKLLGDQISVRGSSKRVNVFGELMKVLEGTQPSFQELHVRHLLPQILPGHRLWTYATQASEKFLALSKIRCYVNGTDRTLWLQIRFDRGEARHLTRSWRALIRKAHLPGNWDHVHATDEPVDDGSVVFEQRVALPFLHRPMDCLQASFQELRPALWYTVTSTPPHRQYYLFLESQIGKRRLPQWASMYVLFFYLSDLTRYRPHLFDLFIEGRYGPQIENALDECPRQFLYLMASELLQRDVAPAAIV